MRLFWDLGATVLLTWIAMLAGAWYVHNRDRDKGRD